MNILSVILIAFALIIYIWPSITIHEFLKKKNDKTPGILHININISHFLKEYRKRSKIQYGRTGSAYYFWFVSLALSLILLTAGILIEIII
ncbi:MAG: hypothetical protein U5N56_01690 [Candidatus Marinimicrobia bacterium]|nr:hypothetical protein [Candidatus Neomarinimicrobiota bacterium]